FKGQALSRSGDYQKALAAYERADKATGRPVGPRESRIFHERAIAYNGLRQYDKALAAADRAIELGDNSPWLRSHRGSALLSLERFDEAISDFNRFRNGGDTGMALQFRGECYVRKRQWREALADFNELVRLEPDNLYCWHLLAVAQLAAGNLDDYRSTCAKMLERFGQTKSPAEALWITYAIVTRDDALSDKSELVRLAKFGSTNAPGAQRAHAAALYRARDYKGALEEFEV